MGILKSLIRTLIIGGTTTTTINTLEPIPRVERFKSDMRDAWSGFKSDISDAVTAKKNAMKAKKSTKIFKSIKINNKKANRLIGTSLITGLPTTTTGSYLNNVEKKIDALNDQKSLSTYVNSMSDEELVEALEKMNLLDSEDNSKVYTKTR